MIIYNILNAYAFSLCIVVHGVYAEDKWEQMYVGTSGFEFQDSLLFSYKNTISAAECAVLCFSHKCLSFTYNKDTKQCRTHSRKFCTTEGAISSANSAYFETTINSDRTRCEGINLMLQNGVYQIYPSPGQSRKTYCYCAADNMVWNVFQYRFDGTESFYKTWNEYKKGFGSLSGEFWLGNEEIHRLTSDNDSMIRIEMEDFNNNKKYAQYSYFLVEDEANKYRINIGLYTGTAGDSFITHQNGKYFTTKDSDNDIHPHQNCAVAYTGGYWYSGCFQNNLNGKYKVSVIGGGAAEDSMSWPTFRNPIQHMSLKVCKMMIRKR